MSAPLEASEVEGESEVIEYGRGQEYQVPLLRHE